MNKNTSELKRLDIRTLRYPNRRALKKRLDHLRKEHKWKSAA